MAITTSSSGPNVPLPRERLAGSRTAAPVS
jgi:hypothetical protein